MTGPQHTAPAGADPAPDAGALEIRAEAVRKSFGEQVVLAGVSRDIFRGQIVAIVGASGSGKTVFLDIIAGLMKPDDGRVLVADHGTPGAPLADLHALDEDGLDRVRLAWAFVFQRNALFSGTVEDNIALWLKEHTSMTEAGIAGRVRESIESAALDPDEVLNKQREELSGGMAKRVAIARAIAVDPVVLFYDEPTTGLDPIISGKIHELIWNVHHRPVKRSDGTEVPRTSIIVTHDKDLLRRVRPRVVLLHNANICFDGDYDEFGLSGLEEAKAYIRAMPILHARAQH